jgi:single-strand DNA-binding protein
MLSWHKTVLFGYLGNDANMRYLPTGTAVLDFNVSALSGKKDANGNWTNHTTWFKCTIWGDLAEKMNPMLLKGTPVYVEGEIVSNDHGSPRIWQTNEGESRATFELRVTNINVLSKGNYERVESETSKEVNEDSIPF